MALTKAEKAILDTIAYSEGTLGVSNNGYDVVVTFKIINGWTKDTKIVHGGSDWAQRGLPDPAAGRYQFKIGTWSSKTANNGINKPMTKDNQDNAAINMVNYRLKSTLIDNRSVTIEELPNNRGKFDIFLQKCAPEWSSFPLTKNVTYKGTVKKAGSSFYGENHKTADELYDIFMLAYSKY